MQFSSQKCLCIYTFDVSNTEDNHENDWKGVMVKCVILVQEDTLNFSFVGTSI